MAKKIIAEPVAKQLEFVLSSIAQNADALEHLISECVMEDDVNNTVSRLLKAAEAVVQHIGMTADLGSKLIGSISVMKGGAEGWTMPPAYHEVAQAVEVARG